MQRRYVLWILLIISSEEEKAKKDPKYYLNRANKDTLGILSELERTYKEPVSNFFYVMIYAV